MSPTAHFFVLGASGPPAHFLPGVAQDAARWVQHGAVLAGPNARVVDCSGGEVTAERVRAAVHTLVETIQPEDTLTIAVLGHGAATARGPGLRTDDGEVICLAELVAGVPDTCPVTWYRELCGSGGPQSLSHQLRPSDVVHASSRPDQPSEQRCIEGTWRGAWSFAMHLVLEQATGTDEAGRATLALDHHSLSTQASQILGGLGLAQTPTLTGPSERLHGPVLAKASPLVRPAPRLAMQVDSGTECIWMSGSDAWMSMTWSNNKLKFRLRTGETVADLPSTLTLSWRSPTSGELTELGGPNFKSDSDTFTNVGAVTAGGGRLYSAAGRTFVLAIGSAFDKIVWWTEGSELDASDHIEPTVGDETMHHVGSPPSPPSGGWEKAVDS